MDERQLLELLETDPEGGMALLQSQYGEPVRYAAAQRLDCTEDVRFCVHDTFADFYLHRERFDPEKGSLRAYLTAIAERKAIRRWRENRRRQMAEQLSVPESPPSPHGKRATSFTIRSGLCGNRIGRSSCFGILKGVPSARFPMPWG